MSYYRHGPQRPPGIGLRLPGFTAMVKTLVIVNAAIWALQAAVAVAFRVDLASFPAGYGLGLIPASVVTGAIWQVGTYAFLHAAFEPLHLLFNMLMLWMFGADLESAWGSRAFLRYYLVCAVGGGVAATVLGLLAGGSRAMTIGASGAVFGLLVGFGMVFARRTVLFMMMFPMQARTMALIFAGLSFFYLISQPGSGVSHIAHLGGAVTGYLYLKRVWRIGEFTRELRWKLKRRKFKVMSPKDPDEWIH